jgi:hypothetical protein
MMLIATSLAAALFASSSFAADAVSVAKTSAVSVSAANASAANVSLPPMIINVATAPNIPATVVARMLEETDAIWRGTGFTFLWQHAAREVVPYARTSETGPYVPSTLRVVVGNDPGTSFDGKLPLGWIVFDDATTPEQEIHVSYSNAQQFMVGARGIVGIVAEMPINQHEWLVGRAMGRALAHELGHYLLASKAHSAKGLMRASRTAAEFFAIERKSFEIDPAQRRAMVARQTGESLVVSR